MKELDSTVIVKIDLLASCHSFILLNLTIRLDRRMRINLNINKSSINSICKYLIYGDYNIIVLGCDVHKKSHTVVAVDSLGRKIKKIKIMNTASGFQELLEWSNDLNEEKMWGIENSQHYGKHLTQFLIEKQEKAYEISPKLTAQLRGRSLKADKSDDKDALAIAKAVIQEKENLHKIQSNETDFGQLKELTRFRDSLVKKKTDFINQLHKALYSFDPEYKDKTGNLITQKGLNLVQEKYLDPKTDKPLQNILKKEIEILLNLIKTIDKDIKNLEKEEISLILKRLKSPLSSLDGVGSILLAVLLAEIGNINQYKSAAQLASRAGISPLENSSAKNNYKRVNSGGNKHLHTAIHRIALYQIRKNELASTYYLKKKSEGKTSKEALRCLKRRLVDIIFSILKNNKIYELPESPRKSSALVA